MKRNLIYSLLVFGLFFSWVFSGAITQLSMGVLSSNDLGFFFGLSLAMGGFVAALFFVIFRAIRNKFFAGVVEPGYRPGKKFAAVASVLLTLSIVGSVTQSYSVGKEKTEATKTEAKRKEAAAKALAERQEKEKQRLAAMSPEEREAEARRKKESIIAPIVQEGDPTKYYQVLADKCVGIIKSRLHDPTDAELPSALSVMDFPGKFYVGERKKGTITVQFEMRARNGFNALRKSTAECQWRHSKDDYVLVDVKNF